MAVGFVEDINRREDYTMEICNKRFVRYEIVDDSYVYFYNKNTSEVFRLTKTEYNDR